MSTGITGAIIVLGTILIGLWKFWFSKDSKEKKWRKKLNKLESKRDKAYTTSEHLYNEFNALIQLHIEQGRSSGFKRL